MIRPERLRTRSASCCLALTCLLLLCLLLAGCGSREPQSPWQEIELGTDADFRGIHFLDAMNGWMVGGVGVSVPGGIVARTRDGGLTWEYRTGIIPKRPRTTSIDINAVFFMDEQRGVVAAGAGTIMRTEDGGTTWQKVPPTGPIYAQNRDVEFLDERHGWLIGRQGVLGTETGGARWRNIAPEVDDAGQALDMIDHERGWIVGRFGLVMRTDDGGVTWEQVPALGDLTGLSGDEKPDLRAVHFVDRDHGWAAGFWREMPELEQFDWAVIIATTDGGRTWQRQVEGVEVHLTGIRFADRRRGWAVGYNRNHGTSTILATGDGGATWAVEHTVHGEELRDIEIRDGHAWTAGDRVHEGRQVLLRRVLDPVGDGGLREGVDDDQ